MEAGQHFSQPSPAPTGGESTLPKVRGNSVGTLLAGILALFAGVVAIGVPVLASVTVALLIGWILVGYSAFVLIDAFSRQGFARIAFRVVLAVVYFAAGMYLVVAPLRGTYTLTVMLVIWFVASGCTQLMMGIAEWKLPGAGWTALSGVFSVILGVLVANHLPVAAAWAIGLLVGLQLVVYGFATIATWFAFRTVRADSPAPPRGSMPKPA